MYYDRKQELNKKSKKTNEDLYKATKTIQCQGVGEHHQNQEL